MICQFCKQLCQILDIDNAWQECVACKAEYYFNDQDITEIILKTNVEYNFYAIRIILQKCQCQIWHCSNPEEQDEEEKMWKVISSIDSIPNINPNNVAIKIKHYLTFL